MESFKAFIVMGRNDDKNIWEYLQTMNVIDGLWDTTTNPANARLFSTMEEAIAACDFCQDPEVGPDWSVKEISVLMGVEVWP